MKFVYIYILFLISVTCEDLNPQNGTQDVCIIHHKCLRSASRQHIKHRPNRVKLTLSPKRRKTISLEERANPSLPGKVPISYENKNNIGLKLSAEELVQELHSIRTKLSTTTNSSRRDFLTDISQHEQKFGRQLEFIRQSLKNNNSDHGHSDDEQEKTEIYIGDVETLKPKEDTRTFLQMIKETIEAVKTNKTTTSFNKFVEKLNDAYKQLTNETNTKRLERSIILNKSLRNFKIPNIWKNNTLHFKNVTNSTASLLRVFRQSEQVIKDFIYKRKVPRTSAFNDKDPLPAYKILTQAIRDLKINENKEKIKYNGSIKKSNENLTTHAVIQNTDVMKTKISTKGIETTQMQTVKKEDLLQILPTPIM